MKRITAVLFSMILALAGCSGSGREEQGALPAPAFEALNETVDGRPDLYLIVKNLDSSYWKVMIDGARDGGAAFDCNVYCSGT